MYGLPTSTPEVPANGSERGKIDSAALPSEGWPEDGNRNGPTRERRRKKGRSRRGEERRECPDVFVDESSLRARKSRMTDGLTNYGVLALLPASREGKNSVVLRSFGDTNVFE